MPGVYQKGDLELVGFGVGVVERDKLIDGSSISQGDVILGLASSGVHSNGYSLVRRIVDTGIRAGSLDLRAENAELNTTLASALLAPDAHLREAAAQRDARFHTEWRRPHHRRRLRRQRAARAAQGRARPHRSGAPGRARRSSAWLQRRGEISDDEMLRVFNCGIGMVLIVPREQANDILERLEALGERAYRIGEIEAKAPDEPALLIDAPQPAAS